MGPPASQSKAQDYFGGASFDTDDFDGAGAGIALDTGEDRAASPRDDAAHFGGNTLDRAALRGQDDGADDDLDVFQGSTANAQAVQAAPTPPVDRRKWPAGAAPDVLSLRFDAVDVTLAADYGPVPTSAFTAPGYAVRVLLRRRALDAKLKELSAAVAAASKKRDELLSSMVQDLRGKILMADTGDTLFEPIVAIERTALERRSALAGTSAEYDARIADLAEKTRVLERETEENQAVLRERSATLDERVRSFDRADAKKKRLYIELGGLVRLSEKAGGKLSPEQAQSVTRLEAAIATQKPELDAAAAALEASRAALGAAEAEARKIALRAREVERLRRALDQEFQKQIGARSQGVSESEQQRLDALAAIGRRVLAEKGRLVDVRTEVLDGIARADQVELERVTELEKFTRARHSFDADALKRGVAMIAAVVTALVIGLVVIATR